MRTSNPVAIGLAILIALAGATSVAAADEPSVERGRYLIVISGCNDCHTDGWLASAGQTPEDQWLTGSGLGWRGPWGTTYPANIRITMDAFDEDDWVAIAKEIEYRPPMPWWGLRAMTETDLRSIYRFIKQLGEPGEMAPTYVPPDQEPKTPYVLFPSPPGE